MLNALRHARCSLCSLFSRQQGTDFPWPLALSTRLPVCLPACLLQDGVPRGAYRGVVAVRNLLGARIFVAPVPGLDFSGELWTSACLQPLTLWPCSLPSLRLSSRKCKAAPVAGNAAARYNPNAHQRVDSTGAIIRTSVSSACIHCNKFQLLAAINLIKFVCAHAGTQLWL